MGASLPPQDPPGPPDGAPGRGSPLERFGAPARAWFAAHFEAPTAVQARGWPVLGAGGHALLLAPTGSGKTLAAFFACLDRLCREREPREPGVRVLYVSPLKALAYDIERNLRAPLVGIQRAAERLGEAVQVPRVAVRTGDTPQKERRDQTRHPAEILVTTPESLYLILGSQQRETLRRLETIIVDEIHALAPTKRGAHLALSLERVAAACPGREPQRIGLSATARPLDEVARFLGGDRSVEVVDTHRPPRLDLRIRVPTPDMTRPEAPPRPAAGRYEPLAPAAPLAPGEGGHPEPDPVRGTLLEELALREPPDPSTSMWSVILPELHQAILEHRSTLVFVNSRGLCERLANRLNELAGEELALAHHGSIAHGRRREIEESLKAGRLRALVATSSLELGIDMGAIDQVLLVESPGAVSRGLQRLGRAGHQVGVASQGSIFPKHRSDLLEATVVARGMRRGEVEPLAVPRNPLDVLAQQVVAIAAVGGVAVGELEALLRRTASYRDLSRDQLCGVLDMLSGRYPSTDFGELRPRLIWDRERDRIEARPGAGKLALLSGGTIPDRGLYGVHVGPDGPRIGELDEEMVYETRAGEVVTLGASSWRVLEITRDRVVVEPAPGETGKLPFWKGEGPGRPIELGRTLGAFTRELAERCRERPGGDLHPRRADGEAWLRDAFGLDEWAARNLVDHLEEQWTATGTLPTDRRITVERFRDELGDWRVCLLSPFGSRVHAPWALAIEARLSEERGVGVQTLWSDDGIVLRFADADEPPDLSGLIPEPEEVEDRVVEQLERSALFAGHFRENAARALLLPRRRPGARTPLWTQRLRAQNLLGVAREYPSFPIMLETYRSCLQDVFDLPALVEVLSALRDRRIAVDEVETASASPFARSLVYAYTAVYLYQGDVPVAERRVHALSLDRAMLRDLLGREDLRTLLDPRVVAEVEAELQGRAPEFRARHPDGLHDLLRRVGDLSDEEVAARCAPGEGESPAQWLRALQAARRVVSLKIGGEERWIAAEDAGLLRDALGAALPPGLPDAFLESPRQPMDQLLLRWLRHHAPAPAAEVAGRYCLVPAQVESLLEALETRGRAVSGEFLPGGAGREWADPEVLRRLRRRTLARLRGQVAAVDGRTLARFLARWHGVSREAGSGLAGTEALEEVLDRLEGWPVSFRELESALLPARIPGYDPRQLDELGAMGQLVWIGRGALGARDGRIALYRRDRVSLRVPPPERPEALTDLARHLLDQLETRGASFFADLVSAFAERAGAPELLEALWELVWAGLVTNDTLAPLRAQVTPGPRPSRSGRGRWRSGRAAPSPSAGRWSAVSALLAGEAEATRVAHARALLLLERHGVACRAGAQAEGFPGGFAAVYPVLRAMEEAGKLRRGHFVEGLDGAQFAYAGVVDRLRGARPELAGEGATEPEVVVLAACDPANPYGSALAWPPGPDPALRPRRSVGSTLVLVDGWPALFLERGGGLQRFEAAPGEDEERAGETLERAAAGLRGLFRDRTRREVRVTRIDGQEPAASPAAEALVRAGFRRDYRGLVLERSGVPPDARGR